jgi:hypothetical protein
MRGQYVERTAKNACHPNARDRTPPRRFHPSAPFSFYVALHARAACDKRTNSKVMTLTGDELILVLISLVRATRPGMLRQEADGFTVDFEAIARSKTPGAADRLLLKIGALMENPAEDSQKDSPGSSSRSLELDPEEARQISDALAMLELLQAWPKDVVEMSRALRARLASTGANSRDR